MRQLPRYTECFICGRKNIAGADVTFFATDKGVECDYTAQSKHQSYKGILHGGIISALLDECCGWSVGLAEKKVFVTAELNIKYIQLIPIGTEIKVKGFYSENQNFDDKYRTSHGVIEDKNGIVYATAEGKFYPVPQEFEEPLIALMEKDNDPLQKVNAQDIWG